MDAVEHRQSNVAEWYDRYRDVLLRHWSAAMSGPDAHELVQEIFLRVLRVKDTRLISNPRAYLFRIGAHVLAEWRPREKQFPGYGLDPEVVDEGAALESDVAEQADAAARMQSALASLPPMVRAVVVLHAYHGLTYAETAGHLGVSRRMVKRYILKGYAQLRMYYAEHA